MRAVKEVWWKVVFSVRKSGVRKDKTKSKGGGEKISLQNGVKRGIKRKWKETSRHSVGSCLWEKVPPPEGLRCFSQKQQKVNVSGAGRARVKHKVWTLLGDRGV